MQQSAIFGPFIGMMLLSFLVWTYMYARRLHFFYAEKIDPQRFAARAKSMGAGPDAVQNPANNLLNLFELPVLFYALCLYLFVTNQVDQVHVVCGWIFLTFRTLHSLIHSTFNRVLLRFLSYAAAAISLWVMVIRAALNFG